MRYENGDGLPASVRSQIEWEAARAYEALELRDMARIDLRLDLDGMPRVIDVNPLPGLNPEFGDLPILFGLNGGDYSTLIKILLEEAFSRCGLAWPAGCRNACPREGPDRRRVGTDGAPRCPGCPSVHPFGRVGVFGTRDPRGENLRGRVGFPPAKPCPAGNKFEKAPEGLQPF